MSNRVCYPPSIEEWVPNLYYPTFVMKQNSPEKLSLINDDIKKCCNDIENIQDFLRKIKNEMGNSGVSSQLNRIIIELEDKRLDLIKKNNQLLSAANQVINYVYNNKSDKQNEAALIGKELSSIVSYRG